MLAFFKTSFQTSKLKKIEFLRTIPSKVLMRHFIPLTALTVQKLSWSRFFKVLRAWMGFIKMALQMQRVEKTLKVVEQLESHNTNFRFVLLELQPPSEN